MTEYKLNMIRYKTIEALNKNGKRIWVKPVPINATKTVRVAHILDRPDNVKWSIKESYIEEIGLHSIKPKNCVPAITTGSICVNSGTFTFFKEPNAQVPIFPLDPIVYGNSILECSVIGNLILEVPSQ